MCALASFYEDVLKQSLGSSVSLWSASPCSGGCIHRAHRLRTSSGDYFIKWNAADAFNEFEAEAQGLRLLASTANMDTPEVHAYGVCGDKAYLLLAYLEPSLMHPHAWQRLGEQLAHMHACTAHAHGLHRDNYLARQVQSNTWTASGVDFYRDKRLRPQLEEAQKKGRIDSETLTLFHRLYGRMAHLWGDDEPPALVHGDLWKGNIHLGPKGYFALIDPAVYYGHREADWALMTLFGGFPKECERAYNQVYPRQQGWQNRSNLHQLYPLLIHLNLFGNHYLRPIKQALKLLLK